MSFFRTVASDRAAERLSTGFWENTDMTFMLNNSDIQGWGDVRMHFSNLGFLLRKQVLQRRSYLRDLIRLEGVTASSGVFYSRMTAREDEMGHAFHTHSTDPGDRDILVADPSTGGRVTVASPSTPQNEYMGIIYYPYIDFTTLSAKAEITGYANLFRFLDVFTGARLALIPHSTYYADISMDVKVKVSDDNGLNETHLGQLKATGLKRGDLVAAQLMLGLQMNFGPVKVSWQLTSVPGCQVGSFVLVVAI